MDLTVAVHREGSGYWSEVDELPGCFASGRTLSELEEALAEAIEMCVEQGPVDLRCGGLEAGRDGGLEAGRQVIRVVVGA